MLKDPAYRYMIASEKEKAIYAEINDLKEWLRKRDARRSYTMEGSYLDINTIIAEIDRRFPESLSSAEMRLDINKEVENHGRI